MKKYECCKNISVENNSVKKKQYLQKNLIKQITNTYSLPENYAKNGPQQEQL